MFKNDAYRSDGTHFIHMRVKVKFADDPFCHRLLIVTYC